MYRIAVGYVILVGLMLVSCSEGTKNDAGGNAHPSVEVTHVERGEISDSKSLQATSFYQSRRTFASPVSGYIRKAGFQVGDAIERGQLLFTITTKEANALHNVAESSGSITTPSELGRIQIRASSDGFLTSVYHVKGDYVQEGASLAQLVRPKDVGIKLFVPKEYSIELNQNEKLVFALPDGEKLATTVTGNLHQVEKATQSDVWLLKPVRSQLIPEGLTFSIHLPVKHHVDTQLISKDAVLADETLQSFWVMKVIDDSLAIRVPIRKGIETDERVEILEPHFSATDPIVKQGQYGLEDSTWVHVINPGR
jgi:biotin carboxyl carrier protein